LIVHWAWPDLGDMDFDRSRELIERYQETRTLTETEKLRLFDALKISHLTCVGWFLDTESFPNNKRKAEFLNALGRQAFYDRLF
jgi:hypothetical protein